MLRGIELQKLSAGLKTHWAVRIGSTDATKSIETTLKTESNWCKRLELNKPQVPVLLQALY